MDHFINVLKDEIRIVRTLPDEYSWSTREYYAVAIRATRIKTAPVHASATWYLENVIPVLQRLVHEHRQTTKTFFLIKRQLESLMSFAIQYVVFNC